MSLILEASDGVRFEVYVAAGPALSARKTASGQPTDRPYFFTANRAAAYKVIVSTAGALSTAAANLADGKYDETDVYDSSSTAYALYLNNSGTLSIEAWTSTVRHGGSGVNLARNAHKVYVPDSRFKPPTWAEQG